MRTQPNLSILDPPKLHGAAILMLALIASYVAILFKAYLEGIWVVGPSGEALPSDFAAFYTTGVELLRSEAAEAYDWKSRMAAERALFPGMTGFLGWHYAPPLFLAVAPLGLLTFAQAYLAWTGVTLTLYVAGLRLIFAHWAAIPAALAFPAVLWNLVGGQTGFLSAALVAATLAWMRPRPVLAGVCLGLLCYKPHFGLLFPLALAASGRWRTVASASATVIVLVVLTALIHGPEVWTAFLGNLPMMQHAVLVEGRNGFEKLQSVFGLLRANGVPYGPALAAQATVGVAAAVAVWRVWRAGLPFELQAAALGTAVLLATPYAFIYDAPLLAVPFAFLVRHALLTGILPGELTLAAAAVGALLAFPVLPVPGGLLATLMVAGLAARRIRLAWPSSPRA